MQIRKVISAAMVFALISGCARDQRMISHLPNEHPSAELELGEAINQRITANIPTCRNLEVIRYVQSVGDHLAAYADRKDLTYRFVVLDDDRIHATHAPGGFVYVTTGFLEFLQSEIELAGVLAYEIGALQYRDPRLTGMKKTTDFILQAGSMAAPAFGAIGALSLLGLVAVKELVAHEPSFMGQVKKADGRALEMMTDAGYDPQGLLDVLRRINDPRSKYRPYLFDYLDSHPMTDERQTHLNQAFGSLPLDNRQFDSKRDVYLAVREGLQGQK